jgi:hypothetical protein
MRELQVIRANGAKEHPLEDEMKDIRDRLGDIEQVVASLPCAPGCETAKKVGG